MFCDLCGRPSVSVIKLKSLINPEEFILRCPTCYKKEHDEVMKTTFFFLHNLQTYIEEWKAKDSK